MEENYDFELYIIRYIKFITYVSENDQILMIEEFSEYNKEDFRHVYSCP
jgi:hypothetical protein